MTARTIIRASNYRGEPGFSLSGRDALGRRLKIFAKTRPIAERIRAKVVRGEQITLDDFQERE